MAFIKDIDLHNFEREYGGRFLAINDNSPANGNALIEFLINNEDNGSTMVMMYKHKDHTMLGAINWHSGELEINYDENTQDEFNERIYVSFGSMRYNKEIPHIYLKNPIFQFSNLEFDFLRVGEIVRYKEVANYGIQDVLTFKPRRVFLENCVVEMCECETGIIDMNSIIKDTRPVKKVIV